MCVCVLLVNAVGGGFQVFLRLLNFFVVDQLAARVFLVVLRRHQLLDLPTTSYEVQSYNHNLLVTDKKIEWNTYKADCSLWPSTESALTYVIPVG